MIRDFFTHRDVALFNSGSRFALSKIFLDERMDSDIATFDLVVRELPLNRNFLIFAGLEHVAEGLLNFKFSSEHLKWLRQSYKFSPKVINYFRNFKFTGDMWAMPEGSVFFPNEPVVRITAPIIEAQLIEFYVLNTVYLQTILASKIIRFILAANGKEVTIGFNRTYGTDAALKSARINEILGVSHSLSLFHQREKMTGFSFGTFHYLIMSFDDEKTAFRSYMERTQGKGYVLIDTYDSIQGIKNFIEVAKELESKGIKAPGIQLDSGNLYDISNQARKMLDQADLNYVKIFAMGNLDEYKVSALEKRRAPIDVYAGTTGILTPEDAPVLELVYKLSEIKKNGKVFPKMKTSTDKISLPGRKQVFRQFKRKKISGDIVSLENEKTPGKKMLIPIIKQGKRVYKYPRLEYIGDYIYSELSKLKTNLLSIEKKAKYPVKISKGLHELIKTLVK